MVAGRYRMPSCDGPTRNLVAAAALCVEYQFWMNKLGDGSTDENTVQALRVWEF